MISTLSPIFRFHMQLSLFSLKITKKIAKYNVMYCIHGVTCLRTMVGLRAAGCDGGNNKDC